MKPWELLGQTTTPDGSDMALTRRDSEYVIGEYSKLSDARDALALAMLPSAGGIH